MARRLWPGGFSLNILLRSSLARDHAITFVTEVVGLCSAILLLKLGAGYWGASGFGEFVLGRRALGFIQLPVLMGMGLAVTRSVAMAVGAHAESRAWGYLDAALMVIGVTCGIIALGLVILAPWFAQVVFGDAHLASLARSLVPCVAGMVMHSLAYGYLRGRRTMGAANVLQLCNMAILPLAVLAIPGLRVAEMYARLGVAWMVVSGLALFSARRSGPPRDSFETLWRGPARELLIYGVPRIPGEFMLGALTLVPVSLAAHLEGKIVAGQVGLGLSLLSMTGSLFNPLAQVMLPHLSARVAAGRVQDFPRLILIIAGSCTAVGLVGCLVLELLAPWLLPRFLGPEFASAVPPVRIIVLATVPYVAYIVLRTVLDAIHAAPHNTSNLFIALVVLVMVSLLDSGAYRIPHAVFAALTSLGLLSVWRTWRVVSEIVQRAPREANS